MRFSLLGKPGWSKIVQSCLSIGTQCVICARLGAQGIDLCDDCESLLARCRQVDRSGYLRQLCLSCGQEISASNHVACSVCQTIDSPFSRILAPYRYEFPVNRLLHALKYGNQRVLARVLGGLLAREVRRCSEQGRRLPDCLIPVPLHQERLAQRGYNQSADMARWCARELGLLSRSRSVVREVDTGSLAGLNRAERQHRILGAFRAESWVADRHLAIVDDVLTTGSTARELARELYDSGAASVELWVLARTSSDR